VGLPVAVQVERCKAVAAAKHMKAAATLSGHQQRHQQQQHNADGSAEQVQPAAAAAAAGATPAAGPGKAAGYNVAYVGNIAFEAGPDELKALFAECGVTKVRGCGSCVGNSAGSKPHREQINWYRTGLIGGVVESSAARSAHRMFHTCLLGELWAADTSCAA
jgi:hypothetical protein